MTRGIGVTEALRQVLPDVAIPVVELAALPGDLPVVAAVLAAVVLVDVRTTLRDRHDSTSDESASTARGADRRGRTLRSRSRAGSTPERESLVARRTAFVVGVVIGGLALTLILKTVLGLPRPPADLQAIGREGYGFPSGHTMAATILWGALAWWFDRPGPRTSATLAAVLVGAVAFSRLALGVHYLVDVVAAVAAGIGYLWIVRLTLDGEPSRAMALAAALGTIALAVSGATTDGQLAFVGSLGAATGWWLTTRPSISRLLVASIE